MPVRKPVTPKRINVGQKLHTALVKSAAANNMTVEAYSSKVLWASVGGLL